MTLLGFWHSLLLDLNVCLDLKTNLCRFLHTLLVAAEAEVYQRPEGWNALPTVSTVSPVLDNLCWMHFLGEVEWCSTGCTVSWCPNLCFLPKVAFQAHLRASHHSIPLSCFGEILKLDNNWSLSINQCNLSNLRFCVLFRALDRIFNFCCLFGQRSLAAYQIKKNIFLRRVLLILNPDFLHEFRCSWRQLAFFFGLGTLKRL